MKINTW